MSLRSCEDNLEIVQHTLQCTLLRRVGGNLKETGVRDYIHIDFANWNQTTGFLSSSL